MPRRAPSRAAVLKLTALTALTAAVLLLHLLLLAYGLPSPLGSGAGAGEQPLSRIEVAFVRELAPAAPVPRAVVLSTLRRPRTVSAVVQSLPTAPPEVALGEALAGLQPALPELAELPELSDLLTGPVPDSAGAAASAALLAAGPASAPSSAVVSATQAALASSLASSLASAAPSEGSAPAPLLPATQALAMADAAASAASAASSPAVAFDWPPSTRLSYVLTGNYRGPVDGRAQVEWLRQGTRYQVHMELGIGPPFANLVSRRVSSEGEITPQGLYPQRYDETTRVALRDPRRLRITLGTDQIQLPNGRSLPRPPGVQDSASQFVQMTWLFTLQPALLQAGRQLDLPLALPRDVQTWTYDVVGPETLFTPVGALQTVHVKPRREPRPGVDLTAELWFAPSLQYLPVRILVRHDAETYVDLLLDRLPQQSAVER